MRRPSVSAFSPPPPPWPSCEHLRPQLESYSPALVSNWPAGKEAVRERARQRLIIFARLA